MSSQGDVLVTGPEAPLTTAIVARLTSDGFRAVQAELTEPPAWLAADAGDDGLEPPAHWPADFSPHALVSVPAVPPAAACDDVSLDVFLQTLDDALADMAQIAKAVLQSRPPEPGGRVVLVCDWAVAGLSRQTTAAALSGGLLGLARSWALELAPDGVTSNAVVVGPDVTTASNTGPSPEDVAHAVAFFLHPRSAAIAGQVLSVCGGRTPGLLPF